MSWENTPPEELAALQRSRVAWLRSLRSSSPSRAGWIRFAFVLGLLDDLSVIAILPMTDSPTGQGPPHPAGHSRSTSLINSANRTPGITQLPGFPHTTHTPEAWWREMMNCCARECRGPPGGVSVALPKVKSSKGISWKRAFCGVSGDCSECAYLARAEATFGMCRRDVPSTPGVAGVNSAKTPCSRAGEPRAAHLHRGYRESTMPWAWHRNEMTKKKENR